MTQHMKEVECVEKGIEIGRAEGKAEARATLIKTSLMNQIPEETLLLMGFTAEEIARVAEKLQQARV